MCTAYTYCKCIYSQAKFEWGSSLHDLGLTLCLDVYGGKLNTAHDAGKLVALVAMLLGMAGVTTAAHREANANHADLQDVKKCLQPLFAQEFDRLDQLTHIVQVGSHKLHCKCIFDWINLHTH